MAATLALSAGCGASAASDGQGSAIFEPRHDSFIVAVWSRTARAATIEIAGAPTIRMRIIDEHGHAVVSGLAPATAYDVVITPDRGAPTRHAVRTAPDPRDPRPVRIAVSADLDPQPAFESDLFDQIVAADPDVFVTLGDLPYTDDGPVATTVAAYRQRHGLLRAAPYLRPWLESMALCAIYDDHEFANDWDAAKAAAQPDRLAAALQVWDEFFPLAAAPSGDVRYRNFRYGGNAECFVLDCRRFRSANAAPDTAGKTMLGATQKAWLLAALAASTAPFKLIFTTVPLDFGLGVDHWAGFTTERDEIFAAIRGLPGVVFVSGDQHYFAAYEHAYGIREFQVGPLRRGIGATGPDAPGVRFRHFDYNFGVLDVTPDALTVRGIGPGGVELYREALSAAELTPG